MTRLSWDTRRRPIPPPSADTNAPEKLPSAFNNRYRATRERTRDDGLLVIPVAGPPGTPPEIVRVHAGVELETVSFEANKIGEPPTVPHPDQLDQNNLFLSGTQSAAVPMLQVQGNNHSWHISGAYTYVHKKPVGLDAPLPTGVMPFEPYEVNGQKVNNTIGKQYFSQQIISQAIPDSAPAFSPGIIRMR